MAEPPILLPTTRGQIINGVKYHSGKVTFNLNFYYLRSMGYNNIGIVTLTRVSLYPTCLHPNTLVCVFPNMFLLSELRCVKV